MSNQNNIFFIILDTVRKNSTSLYNSDKDTTPFLEELSEDSIVFENAVSQAPWTLPSHASMFTGKYPSEHGAVQENPHLDEQPTVASILKAEGYKCGLFSANAWISSQTGLTHGFHVEENFLGSIPSPIQRIGSTVWKKFTANDKLKPLAKRISSFISFIHRRYTGRRIESYTPEILSEAKEFVLKNEDDRIFTCINLLDAHLPYTPKDEYVPSDLEEHDLCLDSKKYNSGVVEISDNEWDDIERLYEAEIQYLDNKISEFIGFLKSKDMYDESTIVIASDHGELHGKGGIYGHEFAMYDELLNVPLLIKTPDKECRRSEQTVETMDLFHTILDQVGCDDYVESRSIISDNYRKEKTENLQFPEYAFSEYSKPMIVLHQVEKIADRNGFEIEDDTYRSSMKSVRSSNGKYIYRSEVEDLLFSYEESPGESHNIIEEDHELDHMMILQKHDRTSEIDVEKKGVKAIDDSIEDRLEDLGYLE